MASFSLAVIQVKNVPFTSVASMVTLTVHVFCSLVFQHANIL